MTQAEFLIVIRWTMPALATWCRGKSPNDVMQFKRQLQQALHVYSKTHPFDKVQEKALSIIRKIEKWVMRKFIVYETQRIIKGNPELALRPVTIKAMARQAWEEFNRKESY